MLIPLLASLFIAAGNQTEEPVYYNATFSPNSRLIAFESTRDGQMAIYTIGVDGRNLRRLTPATYVSEQPRWSPNGKKIVFTSTPGKTGQLYLMNPDGADKKQLTNAPGESHFYPSFSPDGKWVAYGLQDLQQRQIYLVGVVRADGTNMRRLTDFTKSSSGPRWSADSKRIIFTQVDIVQRLPDEPVREFMKRVEKTQIVVSIRPDGTDRKPEPTLHVPPEDAIAETSPDNRWSVIAKEVDGKSGVYITDKSTNKERLLAGG